MIANSIKDLYHALADDRKLVTAHQTKGIESLLVNDAQAAELTKTTLKLSLASAAYYQGHQEKSADFGPYDYLQFYARLYTPVAEDNLHQISKKLLEVNAQLPLIGFGLEREEGVTHLHYRHMMLVAANKIDVKLVRRALELIFFLIDEYESSFDHGGIA